MIDPMSEVILISEQLARVRAAIARIEEGGVASVTDSRTAFQGLSLADLYRRETLLLERLEAARRGGAIIVSYLR